MWTSPHSLRQILNSIHGHKTCLDKALHQWRPGIATTPHARPDTSAAPPTHTRTRIFTASDVAAFTILTGDTNPLHAGPNAIVPGLLLASLFPGIIGSTFPGALYVKQTLRFRNPAQVDELVVAQVTPGKTRGAWQEFTTRCIIQHSNQVAVEGTALARMSHS